MTEKGADKPIAETELESEAEALLGRDVLQQLPPEAREQIEVRLSTMQFGAHPEPWKGRINEAHISQILDSTAIENERSYRDRLWERGFVILLMLIFIGFFLVLMFFLVKHDQSLFKDVFTAIAVFIGGFGLGRTFGK